MAYQTKVSLGLPIRRKALIMIQIKRSLSFKGMVVF